MKHSTKIFFSIFLTTVVLASGITSAFYYVFQKQMINDYVDKYKSMGFIISNSFREMGTLSDRINSNAVLVLKEIQRYKGLPSNKELNSLAKQLGVQGFYAIDKSGKFIRSSDLPLRDQTNSLFDYCEGYRGLITGKSEFAVTPIIPSFPNNVPAKFVMIPNYDKSMILESGFHLQYIEETMHQVIEKDKNITSIGLFLHIPFQSTH